MSTEYSSKDVKYYTDPEIAGLLGISLGRLRNKLCAGSPLPPRIQLVNQPFNALPTLILLSEAEDQHMASPAGT